MRNLGKFFIPASDLKQITKGSLEDHVSRVSSKVSSDSAKIFGESIRTQVLSTFPKHALVASEDGRFARVTFEESQKGELEIVQIESVNVPSYKFEQTTAYVHNQAQNAINSFFAGDYDAAREIVSEIVSLGVDLSTPDEEVLAESIIALVEGVPEWKRVLADKTAEIESVISAQLPALKEANLPKKFEKLYDDSIPDAELEGYKGLVQTDLDFVVEKYTSLLRSVTESFEQAKKSLESDSASKGKETVVFFTSFGESLTQDLSNLSRALEESIKNLSTVQSLAIVYDTLAEQLHAYQVAGTFIQELAMRLCKSV